VKHQWCSECHALTPYFPVSPGLFDEIMLDLNRRGRRAVVANTEKIPDTLREMVKQSNDNTEATVMNEPEPIPDLPTIKLRLQEIERQLARLETAHKRRYSKVPSEQNDSTTTEEADDTE